MSLGKSLALVGKTLERIERLRMTATETDDGTKYRMTRLLGEAYVLGQMAEDITTTLVHEARLSGMSWAEIAENLDVSRQAVHRKYRHLTTQRSEDEQHG